MEDKTPVAEAGAPKSGARICRSGRCRSIVIAVLAVAGGLAAWWLPGNRGEPPVAERASSMLPGMPPAQPPAAMTGDGAAAPQVPGLDVMADRLAKRLEKEPADGEGWALLARTYLELGDAAKADAAYAKALALRPDDATMKADYEAARKALKAPSP